MRLKKYKPTSPGIRHRLALHKNLLGKNSSLFKNLLYPLKSTGGRSSITGRTTVWHRGGGVKRKFRLFKGKNFFGGFIVIAIFYDPVRTAYVSLLFNFVSKNLNLIFLLFAFYLVHALFIQIISISVI